MRPGNVAFSEKGREAPWYNPGRYDIRISARGYVMRKQRFAFRSPRCLITALAGMASCLAVCWTGSAYSASAKPSADMPLENKISICYRTKDDQQRLKCYDAAIQAEVDKYKSSQDVLREEWHGNGLLTTRPFHTNPR